MKTAALLMIAVLLAPVHLAHAESNVDAALDKPLKPNLDIRKDLAKISERVATEKNVSQTSYEEIGRLWTQLGSGSAGDDTTQMEIVRRLVVALQARDSGLKRLDGLYADRIAKSQALLQSDVAEESPAGKPTSPEVSSSSRAWADQVLSKLSPRKKRAIAGLGEAPKEYRAWAELGRQQASLPGVSRFNTPRELQEVITEAVTGRHVIEINRASIAEQLALLENFVLAKSEGGSPGVFFSGQNRETVENAGKALRKGAPRRDDTGGAPNPFADAD